MPTNASSSSSNENNGEKFKNNSSSKSEETIERANARIVPAGEALVMGYILEPAKILVEIVRTPGLRVIENVNVDVKDVNFICPDIDIGPLFLEMKELKEILKKILDTKQISQEIGNELVGETDLRWDTQVRFYPTIVFIFLDSEEDFVKRSISDKNLFI